MWIISDSIGLFFMWIICYLYGIEAWWPLPKHWLMWNLSLNHLGKCALTHESLHTSWSGITFFNLNPKNQSPRIAFSSSTSQKSKNKSALYFLSPAFMWQLLRKLTKGDCYGTNWPLVMRNIYVWLVLL